MKKKLLKLMIALVVATGLLGGIVGAGISQDEKITNTTTEKRVLVTEESDITKIVEKISPAVVSITPGEPSNLTFFSIPVKAPPLDKNAIGSGFIISPDGLIITNAHVVENPTYSYQVTTNNGQIYPVVDIKKDSSNDIALLKINAINLPTVKLGDSDPLKPGQRVVAIGTVLGDLNNTVTSGVVSSLNREITAGDSGGANQETLKGVIQVDAALNPGNSGGPLLDLNGNVVGVNFALSENANNIGFSIPINKVKKSVTQLSGGSLLFTN